MTPSSYELELYDKLAFKLGIKLNVICNWIDYKTALLYPNLNLLIWHGPLNRTKL